MSDGERTMHVSAREGEVRCAYCHDPFVEGGASVTCDGCATRLHDDCVVAARCPTLGCEHLFLAPPGGFRVVDQASSQVALRGAPPRTRVRMVFMALFGLVLPIVCFVANENGLARNDLQPEWRYDPSAWIKLVYAPEVQRSFYPLLAWAMAALLATFFGRRGAWVKVGLTGGVVLATAFSIAFAKFLPLSAIGVLYFGIGFLGLGPFLALISYSRALWRYRRERAVVTEKDGTQHPVEEGSTFLLWAVWSLVGSAGLAGAVAKMNVMFEQLPVDPPDDCFVASAAARGHARVVGAEPVRFANGRTIPVTRQLRALKAAELALIALTPRLHRALRFVYDRAGPPLAARLGRTTGTLAWIALLPAQALAELGLRLVFRDVGRLITLTYTTVRPVRSVPSNRDHLAPGR